jgi:hypothetical protein
MSIRPNKYIPMKYSILGVAFALLPLVEVNDTVSTLWERVKSDATVRTFDRFAEALTVLFACRLVSIENGILARHPLPMPVGRT